MLAAIALGAAPARAQPPAFAPALTPVPLVFPRDQGAHPDFRQEWWYVTGNVDTAGGQRLGFELTIFRFALAPGSHPHMPHARSLPTPSAWRTHQLYLGHFAITDVARHRFRFAVKRARGALGLAGAQAVPWRVWVGNWGMSQAESPPPASGSPRTTADTVWHLQADQPGYVLSLTARPLLPPVPNGERGLSRKSGEPGNATYYYSIPRVAITGTIVRDGQPLHVHGLAWLDREWGSGALGPQESGWQWFGLQLDDGSCLMFYALRDRDGAEDPFSAGTWVDPRGRARPLTRADVRIQVLGHWRDPAGILYPSRWRLSAAALGLTLTVNPALANQELVTSPRYWEGAVDIAGTRAGRPIQGAGYVELVGYGGASPGPGGNR